MAGIDIEAYLKRIGHEGPRAPTLDALRAVLAGHAHAIPFENLNPLLGWPVPLDAASLEEKLVRGGRGGYCYEQNLLLRHALEGLGLAVTGLAARVLWNAPAGAVPPRTHMLLLVRAGGADYLADVGFGSQTPTGPLLLQPDAEQATPHGPFRLLRAGGEFVLQSGAPGEWVSLYQFSLEQQHQSDYEVSNWYVSAHPASPFVTRLLVARAAPGRRHALRNNELTVHHVGGASERSVLASAAQIRQALGDVFGLALPDGPELDAALSRLACP